MKDTESQGLESHGAYIRKTAVSMMYLQRSNVALAYKVNDDLLLATTIKLLSMEKYCVWVIYNCNRNEHFARIFIFFRV